MSKPERPKIEFTPRQIEWLEQMFPEMQGTATTTHAEFLLRAGQRQVIERIRTNQQKGN